MGFALLFLQAALVLPLQEATGAGVPAIVVFGDSTVDAGNNNRVDTVLRSNFRPYGRDFAGGKPTGRFCNGRLGTDFISEAVGLRPAVPAYLDPEYGIEDFATAVSFASAGTGYDNATSDVLVSPSQTHGSIIIVCLMGVGGSKKDIPTTRPTYSSLPLHFYKHCNTACMGINCQRSRNLRSTATNACVPSGWLLALWEF